MQARYADALSAIGGALHAETATFSFTAVISAAERRGRRLSTGLAALTGADVAASDDTTGSEFRGGDWQLERASGTVEAASLAEHAATVGDWQGLLDITTGLAAHYSFDDGSGITATDSSGNSNDGTLIGFATWATGQVGTGAIDFNQDFDRVEVPDNAATNFGTGDFSVGFWFNSSDASVGSHRLVGDGSAASNGFIIYSDGANIHASVTGSGGFAVVSHAGLLDGNWHHVVLVREGNLFSFYADGALVDTDNVAVRGCQYQQFAANRGIVSLVQ